ncbi:type IV secretory system conjugative DNA transfer family protein [Amycolatopsis sp. YIM 10]|uniref:type IV secretory system conjugative DNA transfer family protein n=1 Tax=Amycolatopsis sp. YIM 10 TaxID=2653857 RepID=UPI0012A84BFA|nr:FtsK/SpoIIIE domain-containing protein [Amycolatopsis sp. YIM 10]QFU92938.1 DNA translocase FtsK [Amycolatopsis sp. YIM 10]
MSRNLRSHWVDPAPLEVARPRLPWWTMLPNGVKLALSPVILTWLVCWVLFQLGRVVVRYPLLVTVAVLAGVLDAELGHWGLGIVAAGVVVLLVLWWWLHRDSFRRVVVPQPRTEYRRFAVYACQWRTVMRLTDLTKTSRGKEFRPKLGHLRSEGWRDRVRVKMIKGQAPEQWELRASGLAHSFKATGCRVRVRKPGRLELDFLHHDPLSKPVPVPALGAEVDLKRVPVGRTETGKLWRLRLLGTHLLTVGATGAGKGSLLWSVVWALAPLIRTGSVRLVGIDPKGGMELGQAPEVFDRVVFDNGPDAVALLEEIAATVKERATRYRGRLRSWTPATGDPFLLLVVDELADVIAYQPDKHLRERAARAVQTITSQGRAPGVCVLGLLQDPRKEIVSFRHLFSTRIAMRLDEHTQVDMVLGDGVRERGAAAHEISEQTPGVAWAKEDGRREPLRVRAFHVTDANLDELVEYVTGKAVRRAEVLPFRGRDAEGGAAA